MENKTNVIISGTALIVMILLGMYTFEYVVDKEYTTLYRNDSILFREKWYVHAERTYFNLDSWYDENVKCPKVIEQGGRKTETRCYYPDDYYESTSRSLINTKISEQPHEIGFMILKEVPHYAYGTRGAYAGFLREYSVFEHDTIDEKNIPHTYWTDWSPRDTRNYKLQWRITNLKEINLEDGNYTDCNYYFGDVLIDINDCHKLDRVEIDNKNNRMDVWFNAERGHQNISAKVYDPILVEAYKTEVVLKDYKIENLGKQVCIVRSVENPSRTSLYYDSKEILSKEVTEIKECHERKYLLDLFVIHSKLDIFGMKDTADVDVNITTFKFETDDKELIVG